MCATVSSFFRPVLKALSLAETRTIGVLCCTLGSRRRLLGVRGGLLGSEDGVGSFFEGFWGADGPL